VTTCSRCFSVTAPKKTVLKVIFQQQHVIIFQISPQNAFAAARGVHTSTSYWFNYYCRFFIWY